MKGISRELGEMKIPLNPNVKLVKQRPCRLNPMYKQKVKAEIDKMLEEGIIEPIVETEWISMMAVQDKNTGGIRIYLDLIKLNDTCLHESFPTPIYMTFSLPIAL
jgi:hypothetical protein